MIAVVVMGGPSPLLAVVSLGFLIAIGVLAAHLGAYRPKVKRFAVAATVVVALAGATAGADLVIRDPCQTYEPWSVLWVLAGCYLP
jgi:hypothetical protein